MLTEDCYNNIKKMLHLKEKIIYLDALLVSGDKYLYALIKSSMSSILFWSLNATTEQSLTILKRSPLKSSKLEMNNSDRLLTSMTAFSKKRGYFMHILVRGLDHSFLHSH